MTPPRGEIPRQGIGHWRRTAAWYRAPGAAVLGVGLGLAFGRADLVLLVAPLLLGWVLAVTRAEPMLGSAAPRAHAEVAAHSDDTLITTFGDLGGVELASVSQPDPWNGPIGRVVTVAGGGPEARLTAQFATDERGPTVVARPDNIGAGPDGLYLAGPIMRGAETTALVLPPTTEVSPFVLPPIIGGWTGAHVSRRPGQGSDLVDLREFTPGDRLKSVHWRAYARHQRLYTRRTLSDADAEIMVCLDLSALIAPRVPADRGVGHQIAELLARQRDRRLQRRDPALARRRQSERMHERASSTDLAVTVAAAVARAHLAQGDRVGVMTASVPRRWVRPGSGSKYLELIRHELAHVEPRAHRVLDVAWWGLRPGQIVVWCSPLTTETSAQAARQCAARGHRVVVVDTLPVAGLLRHATAADADHLRVLLVEREMRIGRLRAEGIGVVSSDSWALDVAEAARAMRGRR